MVLLKTKVKMSGQDHRSLDPHRDQLCLSMAGATSLVDDIEALVEKHSNVALPVDLLSRVAEEARLMAVREKIR